MSLCLTREELDRLEKPYRPKTPVGVASTAPQNWSLTLKA